MLCLIPILGGLLIMMGQHDRSEALFYYFRLEDQIPETHLLRLIDKHISFAFVREKLKESYSEGGRPSIDPELLLRILLIGYLYGITSERKLVEELRMHLAWRWFTGLGFDQEIPHHSKFSKNRHGRFQESKLFEQLFEQIVRQCVEVGLVSGKNLSVDGSFVEANAAKESRIPREHLAEAAQVHHTVRQYLREVEEQNPVEEPVHEQDQVSTTDPDSTYATKGGTPARLGYYDNYLVDNDSCVIVGVQATAARMSQETVAAQDMLTRFAAWQGRKPESVAADTTYGNGEFLQWLADRGITPYMRTRDSIHRKRTHPHGESHRQVLDGMSGAIVIEGMERYVPELTQLRERVLVVRGRSIEHDPDATALKHEVEIPARGCGGESEKVEEIFSVNGVVRPRIEIAPKERQFWRIVNASPDRYLDLQLDGQTFEIVALDGMPVAYHDPKHPARTADHLLIAPAGRLEAIVIGPPTGTHTALRTLCVDTGPVGDPNPEMVLADIVTPGSDQSDANSVPEQAHAIDHRPPVYKPVDVEPVKKTAPDFIVTFTEDKNGFYINGRKFEADALPMTSARVGTYQHWRIVNATAELHPFHIHQVHFLAYAQNGVLLPNPAWLDTVNVPYGGSVDVILDFTDPVIKGMSVFHCHLLNHEDKGMMAKILFK